MFSTRVRANAIAIGRNFTKSSLASVSLLRPYCILPSNRPFTPLTRRDFESIQLFFQPQLRHSIHRLRFRWYLRRISPEFGSRTLIAAEGVSMKVMWRRHISFAPQIQ